METDIHDSSSPSGETPNPKFQSVSDQIQFQVGYRFCPHDHELLHNYLKKKLANLYLPPNRIFEVNLYQFNPEDLSGLISHSFFFYIYIFLSLQIYY